MKNKLFLLLSVIVLSASTANAKTRKKASNLESLTCSSWHKIRSSTSGNVIGKWRNCSWGRETIAYK